MKKQQKYLLSNKLNYLKLAYIISRYRLSGKKPPKKLIEKVKIARILADYSTEELKNIVKC
jgi:hypothetical protein